MATAERRLTGWPDTYQSSGAKTNAQAAVTISAPGAGKRIVIQQAIVSAGGTVTAGEATLVFTQGGSTVTLGFIVAAGIWSIYFGNNPIVTDDNTSVTLTVPALGASGVGEATLIAFTDLI